MPSITLFCALLTGVFACKREVQVSGLPVEETPSPTPTVQLPNSLSDCGYLSLGNRTYVLQKDLSATGTCLTLMAPGIVLDLNGHTITYDNAPAAVVPNGSFEADLAGSWDLSGAANAQRAAGTFVDPVSVYDGNYALKVTTPAADQTILSTAAMTFSGGRTYSISAMVYNTVSDAISVSIQLSGTSLRATRLGKTTRGFQYISTSFTTGALPESHRIGIVVSGAASAPAGTVFVDDVRIQGHRNMGIMVGPVSWRNPARVSDAEYWYGAAPNAVIRNGKIVQGSGLSEESHGILIEDQSTTNFEISGVEITTKGANSRAILMHAAKSVRVHDNIFHHDVKTISSRDHYDGAAVYAESGGFGSSFFNNIVTSGIQTWLYAQTNSGAVPHEIYGNDITLQTRVSNDFAIVSAGSRIYNNTIRCGSGENSCRGIWGGGITGADTPGTRISYNTIEVQELPRNQEYNGCELFGAYGIQTQGTNDTEVFGNTVTAYADTCEAHAYRANPDNLPTAANNLIHDNTFTAVATGAARASALKLSRVTPGSITIDNNTLVTNRRWIYVNEGTVANLSLGGNTWKTAGVLDTPFYPFEVYTWDTPPASTVVTQMEFRNNQYGSAGDKTLFESEVFRSTTLWPEAEPNSSYLLVNE